MSGKLIVLEGLDGSGKATQTDLLWKYLQEIGHKVQKVTFPDYESPSSSLVKMYLSGEFGTDAESVNAYAASSFYAVDRYASFRTNWGSFYNEGGLILADRYTTSNAVHQCAKLPREHWDEYLYWLFDFEYNKVGIPKPDLVIYLDVDPSVSQKLMNGRYHGDEAKKDIHEKNLAYLEHSRASAQYCVQKLGWTRIRCSQNGEMRTREEIQQEIRSLVERLF